MARSIKPEHLVKQLAEQLPDSLDFTCFANDTAAGSILFITTDEQLAEQLPNSLHLTLFCKWKN
jgi:hypothetical protein